MFRGSLTAQNRAEAAAQRDAGRFLALGPRIAGPGWRPGVPARGARASCALVELALVELALVELALVELALVDAPGSANREPRTRAPVARYRAHGLGPERQGPRAWIEG